MLDTNTLLIPFKELCAFANSCPLKTNNSNIFHFIPYSIHFCIHITVGMQPFRSLGGCDSLQMLTPLEQMEYFWRHFWTDSIVRGAWNFKKKFHKEENHAIIMTRLYWKMDKQFWVSFLSFLLSWCSWMGEALAVVMLYLWVWINWPNDAD
jgi:hypothetical protein